MNTYLKWISLLLSLLLCFCPTPVAAVTEQEQDAASHLGPVKDTLALACASAVLMEAQTGQILYMQNADEAMPPASVTKIMTLLLVMEAIEEGRLSMDDAISASETAASMGGSQIYLKVGEVMRVEDLLKSVVIASANDAAVALAEAVAGDVATFVDQMNRKATELGMSATHFENVTGLDDTAQNHRSSALDIAKMSRALISHAAILEYSSIWMDSIRGGTFGLTNTNRLVRFYRGATGLKTGSTSKAGFCVSATAERDGMSLICVIMGAETRDIRNAQATRLLDWGFANYALFRAEGASAGEIRVTGGTRSGCAVAHEGFSVVLPRGDLARVAVKKELPDTCAAPVREGDELGCLIYTLDGRTLGKTAICAEQTVERIGFWGVWQRLLAKILLI